MENIFCFSVRIKKHKRGFIVAYLINYNDKKYYQSVKFHDKTTGPRATLLGIKEALTYIPIGSNVLLSTTDEYSKYAFGTKNLKDNAKNIDVIKSIRNLLSNMNKYDCTYLYKSYFGKCIDLLFHNYNDKAEQDRLEEVFK